MTNAIVTNAIVTNAIVTNTFMTHAIVTSAIQIFPAGSLPANSADCFYSTLSSLVSEAMEPSAPSLPAAVPPVTANQPDSWWARSSKQRLPAFGGRYMFLRGAWLPQNPNAGWNASASWGSCEPHTGEAC